MRRENSIGFRQLAAELVRLKVDVIVTSWSDSNPAAKEATNTIPIVMAQDSDPVGNGFVASLARPGGNITGYQPLPGAKRKTAGASEGDVPEALPRRRSSGFDQSGQRTVVKRSTNSPQRALELTASIPRRPRSEAILRAHSSRKQGAR